MKLVIAHMPDDAFEPARIALRGLGLLRITVAKVYVADSRAAITLRYRGAALDTHLRAQLRLECVVTDEQSRALIDILRVHAGSCGEVAVLELSEMHREWSDEDVFSASPGCYGAPIARPCA